MAIDIKRLQRWRVGRTGRERTGRRESTDLPLDHQLSFQPDGHERWTYRDGRVFVNDYDVDRLINENPRDISFLTGASLSLEHYKQFVWARGGRGRGKFNAAVSMLQTKIAGRLGSIYEGIVGGVEYEYVDEVLWINNINVRAVVALYRLRPTRQAREYLKGLRMKLLLIITRRHSNPPANGIHRIVNEYVGEIDGALKDHPPADAHLLVADTRCERGCAP